MVAPTRRSCAPAPPRPASTPASSCDDDDVVLSRVVPADGRSRAYIDGRPATAATLADAATDLVDLHGQHAHQRLLSPASQRAALDAFGGVDLEPLRAARARVAELDAELATLGGDERARARELDLARFQLAELDAAAARRPRRGGGAGRARGHAGRAPSSTAPPGRRAYEALAGDGGARDAVAAGAAALAGRAPYRAARRPARRRARRARRRRRRRSATPPRRSPTIPSGSRRCAPAGSCSAICAASTATRSPTCSASTARSPSGSTSLERYEQRAAAIDAERQRAIAAAERGGGRGARRPARRRRHASVRP